MVADLVQWDQTAEVIGVESSMLDQSTGNEDIIKISTVNKVVMSQQEQTFLELLQNPDLDPISRLDVPVQEPGVETVQFTDREGSITSSLTGECEAAEHNKTTADDHSISQHPTVNASTTALA